MVCAGLCSQAHCGFLNVEISWRREPVAPGNVYWRDLTGSEDRLAGSSRFSFLPSHVSLVPPLTAIGIQHVMGEMWSTAVFLLLFVISGFWGVPKII